MNFTEWTKRIELRVRPAVPDLERIDVDLETVTWRSGKCGIVLHALSISTAVLQGSRTHDRGVNHGEAVSNAIDESTIARVASQIIAELRPED